MTREALEKIPKQAQAKLKQYRALYNNERLPEKDRELYRTQAAAFLPPQGRTGKCILIM